MNSEAPPPSKILSVDKLTNGLVLRFQDGRTVLFSSDLLHRTIPFAEILPDQTEVDDVS